MEIYLEVHDKFEINMPYKIDLERKKKFFDEFKIEHDLFESLKRDLPPCDIVVFKSNKEIQAAAAANHIIKQGYQLGNVAHMLYIHNMIGLAQDDLVELGEAVISDGESKYVKSYPLLCVGRGCSPAHTSEFRPGTLFVAFKPKPEE